MSLDKAIKSGKEHRKQYRGAKLYDRTCRNHGGGSNCPCPYCEGNRLHNNSVREASSIEKLENS